jgi:hypothetical protein
MQRALPWFAAILLLTNVALGYLVITLKTEVTQVHLAWDTANQDAQKRIGDLQHKLTSAKEAQTKADKQIAEMRGNPSGAASGGGANGGRRIIHLSDIMKDHPEYEALYAKNMRRNIDRMYGNNLGSLNLSPDQLSQLKNLLVERQMSSMDAMSAAQAAGLTPGTPEYREAMQDASQNVEQQLTALLGSNADATLRQLQVRGNMESQVEFNYAVDFTDAGSPLNPAQSTALVQALADANYGGKDESTRPANYNVVDPATGLSPHDQRIISNAAQVLSPAQVQVLTTHQVENEQQTAIMREYMKGGSNFSVEP